MVFSGLFATMFLTVFASLICLLISSVSAQNICGGAVTNLKAEKITNNSTHLSWDPPASTECADHYKIMYCSYLKDEMHECAFKTVFLPLNSTQYDITELKPCRYNLVQFYTVGTDGSQHSVELFFYTGGGDPPKVDEISLIYVGATNISVYWAPPRGDGNLCYPGYRLCYSAKGDSQENCTYTHDNVFSTMSVAPLSPCTEYNFSVVTVDGNFAADSKTSERTYISVVTAPQVPNITVDVHNSTAHATWGAPDALSMTCAANYLVKNCWLRDQIFPVVCETVSSETLPLNNTEATVSGLDGCIENHVSVSLVGHNGYSSSAEVVVSDPNSEIPVPSHVTVSDVTLNELTMDYDKDWRDCVISHRACWSTGDEDEECRDTSDRSIGRTYSGLHLKSCSNYTFRFAALGRGGRTSGNATTTFLTGPDNVLNQTRVASAHSASLSWREAPSARQCGKNYSISWWELASDNPTQSAVLPLNATSYNVTGLSSCTIYRLQFSTGGINGTTSGEHTDVFTTHPGDLEPLGPFNFQYVEDTLHVRIDFIENFLNCLRSRVTCWYETGESQAQEQCGEGEVTWDSGELKACVNYTFTVNATMNDNRTTYGSTTYTTGPEKVSDVKLEEDASARTVNLSWTNPPSNSLCVQHIQVTTTRVQDHEVTQVKLPSDTTTTTVTDLSPCTTYLFEVKPVTSSVDSGNNNLTRYTTSCGDAKLFS